MPEVVWALDSAVLLICDDCFEEYTGFLAQCNDGCNKSLDHVGTCDSYNDGQRTCDICSKINRLHEVDPSDLRLSVRNGFRMPDGSWGNPGCDPCADVDISVDIDAIVRIDGIYLCSRHLELHEGNAILDMLDRLEPNEQNRS